MEINTAMDFQRQRSQQQTEKKSREKKHAYSFSLLLLYVKDQVNSKSMLLSPPHVYCKTEDVCVVCVCVERYVCFSFGPGVCM